MTTEDLDLVETLDLVAALKRRSAVGVFVNARDLDQDREAVNCVYWGGKMAVLGLLEQTAFDLKFSDATRFLRDREEEEGDI